MSTLRDFLKQLVNVQIVLGGVEYPNTYGDDLAIDRTNLEEEFVHHAERYAYYATLAEMADDRADRLKEDLEHLAAKLDHDVRARSAVIKQSDPSFKMTETMVENEVKMSPQYRQSQTEYQDARYLAKILKNAPHAFAHRRDMLIELGKTSMSTIGSPKVTHGLQQQAKQVLASSRAAPAPSLPAVDYEPQPEAPPLEILQQPMEAAAPVTTTRRRAPRPAG